MPAVTTYSTALCRCCLPEHGEASDLVGEPVVVALRGEVPVARGIARVG